MSDLGEARDAGSDDALQARVEFADALLKLRAGVAPSHLARVSVRAARRAAAPIIDPLIERSRSSAGAIALAGAAAALFYGLGISRGESGLTQKKAQPERPPPEPGSGAPPLGGVAAGIAKSLVLAGAGMAAGWAASSFVPMSERERQFGQRAQRDMCAWSRQYANVDRKDVAGDAAKSIGLPNTLSGMLGVAAFAAQLLAPRPPAGK